jgi:glucose-6-phosphate 1-dehydrogenase
MAQIIPVQPFDGVVFGANGDLSLRKLMPALLRRFRDGQIPLESRIIGVARTEMDRAAFHARVHAALQAALGPEECTPEALSLFFARLFYIPLNAEVPGPGWSELATMLGDAPERIRVFYLATAPNLYGPICRNLADFRLVSGAARVVVEKPIGHDLASARAINDEIGRIFAERQIFRIDHFLGKETVQNLMALRFANSIFERLWTADVVDHVQITVAESVGIEGRTEYYDRAGALRDMVQNHLLQLLCLLAMEPPISLDADAVRDEKLKVLRALRPFDVHEVEQRVVRGQYVQGVVEGRVVPGYQTEIGRTSRTETFVALKAELRSWRWAGVPFYMRTGKRMPHKVSEVVVQFRDVPFSLFPRESGALLPNKLIVRLQPNEGMHLYLMTKDPGPGGMRLRPVKLNISFTEAFGMRYPDAYERLLMDAVRGNTTLFMRRDEVEAAWAWVEPILSAWEENPDPPRAYPAGSWGPTAAIALIERDGRTWNEEWEEQIAAASPIVAERS